MKRNKLSVDNQIIQNNIIRIIWQTVRRITTKIFELKGLWQESRIAPRSSVARTTKSKVKDIRCLHVTTKYTVNDRGK